MSTALLHTPSFNTQSFNTPSLSAQARNSAARSTAAPTRLHLTRRGRFVFGTLLALPILVGMAVFGMNGAANAGDASTPSGVVHTVTVQSGESLWSVAEQIAPKRDPRDVIADIMKLNGLDSANVAAGVSLAVPSY